MVKHKAPRRHSKTRYVGGTVHKPPQRRSGDVNDLDLESLQLTEEDRRAAGATLASEARAVGVAATASWDALRRARTVGVAAFGTHFEPPLLVAACCYDAETAKFACVLEAPRGGLSRDLRALLEDEAVVKAYCDDRCDGSVPGLLGGAAGVRSAVDVQRLAPADAFDVGVSGSRSLASLFSAHFAGRRVTAGRRDFDARVAALRERPGPGWPFGDGLADDAAAIAWATLAVHAALSAAVDRGDAQIEAMYTLAAARRLRGAPGVVLEDGVVEDVEVRAAPGVLLDVAEIEFDDDAMLDDSGDGSPPPPPTTPACRSASSRGHADVAAALAKAANLRLSPDADDGGVRRAGFSPGPSPLAERSTPPIALVPPAPAADALRGPAPAVGKAARRRRASRFWY